MKEYRNNHSNVLALTKKEKIFDILSFYVNPSLTIFTVPEMQIEHWIIGPLRDWDIGGVKAERCPHLIGIDRFSDRHVIGRRGWVRNGLGEA